MSQKLMVENALELRAEMVRLRASLAAAVKAKEEAEREKREILRERGEFCNEAFSLRSQLAQAKRDYETLRKQEGQWHAMVEDRDAQLAQAREALEAFAAEVERAVAHITRPVRGMQVPYHGDFSGATPGTLSRLEWWARHIRAALSPPSPGAETKKRCASTCDGYQCDRPAGHETDEDNREHSARIEALTYCWSGPGDKRARGESATLRSRLETVERERDDLRESFCPAHRKPEHWDDASCEVCLEHELRIEREDHASEVRRAVEEEREACARVAEDDLGEHRDLVRAEQRFDGGASERAAQRIATAIRARGGA